MPIVLQTPVVPAVPSFDKIHLDFFTITLERTNYARAVIQARVRLYYQDEQGNKIFSTDTQDISIDDAEQFAIQLAQQGNMNGVSAMQHIKELVALLTVQCTTYGNADIV